MSLATGNLLADSVAPPTGERFETLLRRGALQVERILSSATPGLDLYEQAQDEWVLLVRGRATLEVDGARRSLVAGDYLLITAGTPHRVLETEANTLWLAVHLHPST